MSALTAADIRNLFAELSTELSAANVRGEVYVLGGAVMCLVFSARPSTKDVDGFFLPSAGVREAVRRVARARDLPDDWLNDAAKGFLSDRGEFAPFLELPNLRVLTATPEYLLAMKCLAMRLGAEFHDEADVRFLLRYLNLTDLGATQSVLERFYPLERFPAKTFYALEELLR